MKTVITPRRFPGAIFLSVFLALSMTLLLVSSLLASGTLEPDNIMAPALTIDKQVDQAGAAAGSTIAYTIVVNNTGDEATQAIFTDTLPADLAYVANSLDIAFTSAFTTGVGVSGDTITWTGSIGPGGSITTIFQATVDGAAQIGGTITNTANVTGTGSLLSDSAVITVIPPLVIDKGVDQSEAEPGSTLIYTVVVTNTGSVAASAAFTDALPVELDYVANTLQVIPASAFTTTTTVANDVINWTGSLGPGGSVTTIFNATVDDALPLGSSVTNIATVSNNGVPLMAEVTTLITNVTPITKYIYMPFISKPLAAPTLQATTPTVDNSWTVSWSQVAGLVTGYRLEEAFDANFTSSVTVFNLDDAVTSRNIQHNPPSSGTYYYRVRAESGNNPGPWSNVVPVFAISDLNLKSTIPDYDNKWTLSWDSAGGVSHYELQESRRDDFSSEVETFNTGTATSKQVQHIFSTDNIRYYRVRAVYNGNPGPWSDTVKVISGYKDVFLSNTTNWAMRRSDTSNYNVLYRDNDNLQVELANANDYILVAPLAPAVGMNYEIEFEAKLSNPEDRHMYGLVFGGDWNGESCPNSGYTNCFTQYYQLRIQYRTNNGAPFLEFKLKRIDGHDSNNQPVGPVLIDWTKATAAVPDDWNVWVVEVESDGDIKISLGDTRIGTVRDEDMPADLGDYFGFWGETNDVGALKIRFDDIQVRHQKAQ
ncbi:MAG: DUF11 domain-containing protein [Ardenticatenaceae bacterium]|nr:DUF11 domain-containing protein [Ardenticatenaceae bacterium]